MFERTRRFFNPEKKGTMRGEIGRSARIVAGHPMNIYQSFKDMKKSDDEGRNKPYCFSPDSTEDDFRKRFKNMRITVTVYLSLFVLCTTMAVVGVYDHVPQMDLYLYMVGAIGLIQYMKYIRDVYRCVELSRNWKLRDEPLTMSWAGFVRKALKEPRHLIPIYFMRGKSHV